LHAQVEVNPGGGAARDQGDAAGRSEVADSADFESISPEEMDAQIAAYKDRVDREAIRGICD